MGEAHDGGDRQRMSAAYDVYVGQPRSASLQVTATARASGASRTQFYAYWETATELGEAVAVFRATTDDCWQRKVMAAGGGDVFGSIRAAVQAPDAAVGASVRAVLAAEPVGSAGHRGLQAWERVWLAWLAERLRCRYGDRTGVPWLAAAATVTALVEGSLLVRGPRLTGKITALDERYAALMADVAADICGQFSGHIDGRDPVLDRAPELVDVPAGAQRLLERIAAADDAGKLEAGHADGIRVLSPKLLAKELGVSERWIYGCWPNADDFNADLFGESLRRLSAVTDQAALTAFSQATITDPTEVGPVLLAINEMLMDLDSRPEPLVLLSLMDLLDHDDIGGQHTGIIQEWCDGNQMRAAAMIQATGRCLLPGISVADYADLTMGTGVGGWRVCAAHRELLDQRCTYLGGDYPTMAAALDTVTQACVEPMDTARHPSG